MSYDPKCYDLAETFLSDVKGATAEDIDELAQAIQDCCEGACREIEVANEVKDGTFKACEELRIDDEAAP